jgi:hypothetical protein
MHPSLVPVSLRSVSLVVFFETTKLMTSHQHNGYFCSQRAHVTERSAGARIAPSTLCSAREGVPNDPRCEFHGSHHYILTVQIIGVIPNAIGAICLNQAGIDFTLAHPTVIEKLVALSSSSDHAHHLGQSLDELVRHHPPIRPLVLAGLLSSLTAACQEGAAFVPKDEEERKKYLLTDTDVVGELDRPADNEPLRKLVMILNVSLYLIDKDVG